MTDALSHRGPDNRGTWEDAESGIALGHRRLAIVDLSPAGHQPMMSASGRWVVAFNGEIYNHPLIRRDLERESAAPEWRGHSDTETLLAGFDAWGIQATLKRCAGMFALAVWDRRSRLLTIACDRIGEKPLYYGWQGVGEQECFLFGSELSSLKRHPSFSAGIDRNALDLFLRHNYVPAPRSIHEGICKLPPGSLLSISATRSELHPEKYWSFSQAMSDGLAAPFLGDAIDAASALEAVLKQSISEQMIADVPLGAFLSGGVDSSTVVALMQAQSSRPVKTFTIGFNEPGYDEATHAKAVARHLGTDHTEMYVTADQALDVIPKLPTIYSEPFADSSQIPTYLVSALARNHVTVALSGDGGDELFCGYQRYAFAETIWRRSASIPRVLRTLAADGVQAIPPPVWNVVLAPLRGMARGDGKSVNFGDKLYKGADLLRARNLDEINLRLLSGWPSGSPVLSDQPFQSLISEAELCIPEVGPVEKMMAIDATTYLPGDILAKVDRAAMSVSLETRVPLLDHRVVEFALRLPQSLKSAHGTGKWILRNVLYKHVPRRLMERQKMGFAVPLADWLRGPLRCWAEDQLDEARIRREGFFDPAPIRKKWEEHVSGRRNWHSQLWAIVTFQAWLEQQRRCL